MDQLPRLGKRELICLLSFTCNYVVFVWRGFLFLWVLGMGYVILLWHSLSLPYNYIAFDQADKLIILVFNHTNASTVSRIISADIQDDCRKCLDLFNQIWDCSPPFESLCIPFIRPLVFTPFKIESPNKRTFCSLFCFCGCFFWRNSRSRNWLFISVADNKRYIMWGLDRSILMTWPRICEHMA